jgi:hypothetical protein
MSLRTARALGFQNCHFGEIAITRQLEQKSSTRNFPEADLVGPRAMARMPMSAKLKTGSTPLIAS